MRIRDLNPAQQKAACTIQGPVLILAGAGTGKTRTITTRITHLLDMGVRPERICAVTFTNKAAAEMLERVKRSAPAGVADKITICTFHSLCVRILRNSIDRLGYKRNFTIYLASDQVGLVKRLIVKKAGKGEKLEPDAALALWSRWRNRGIPAGEDDSLVVEVMTEYQRQLKLLNAVDFDDLLILADKLLREFSDVRQSWQQRYDHIMVDEFQDTNSLQMSLLRNLVGPHKNVCVVGDDDQSIYGWRGAEISNILEFERFFPNPTVVTLEENYRSTTPILNLANSVIRHNRNRRPKKLWSGMKSDEKVRLIAMPGEKEEAAFIVEEIQETQHAEKRRWEDFAVLFRLNSQTRLFEEAMRKQKIPYRVVGGMSFFDRREIKDILAYLNVIANPADDINLLRIINHPPRGLGDTFVEQAIAESSAHREPIFHTFRRDDFIRLFSQKTQQALIRFLELLQRCQECILTRQRDAGSLALGLLEEIDYFSHLKRGTKDPEEAQAREANVREFLTSLRDQKIYGPEALSEFLSSVSLNDDREDSKDDLEKKNGVCLITLHAAKGLEFPIVYLPGLEEGTLPHKRSLEEGTRDEERRLLYVGITRAQKRLTLSYCGTRIRYGDVIPTIPSSFIKELDSQWVEFTTWREIQRRPVEDPDAEFAKMQAIFDEL